MQIEEYVPNNIPNNTAELNPLIASPPNITNAIHTTAVVSTVIIVLDNVSFMLKFNISVVFIFFMLC